VEKNPYKKKPKDMNRSFIASYNGPVSDVREITRWARRFAPDFVKVIVSTDELNPSSDADNDDQVANLPKVLLTTDKKKAPPLLKSLAYIFYRSAEFYLIHDPNVSSPSLSLDGVPYSGALNDKSSIISWLESRTPEQPEDPYRYDDYKVTEFSKRGIAEVVKELPPPLNFYWLVAVVPNLTPSPTNPSSSSIDHHLPGFDDVSLGLTGVLKPGVYVDPDVEFPHLRIFTDLEGGGEGTKESSRTSWRRTRRWLRRYPKRSRRWLGITRECHFS